MTEDMIYLNGRVLSRSEARLSPFDHGFLYGCGLFETMRSYDGHIFRLDRHLARLQDSLRALSLPAHILAALAPVTTERSLEDACNSTLEANKLKNARLRITVTVGEGDMTPDPTTCREPTVLVTAGELVPQPAARYESGHKAVLSSLRRNSHSPLSRIKSTCYVESILARMEAEEAECDEAILLNEGGAISEGSMSNIFLVKEFLSPERSGPVKLLLTPSIDSGVLPGITREAVIEIARALHIEIQERRVELVELVRADEAFLTNSILELMPLTSFEDQPIGTGRPGPITKSLIASYRELVKAETQ